MPRCSSLAGRACTSRALHHAGYARRIVRHRGAGDGFAADSVRHNWRSPGGARTFRVVKVASVYAVYTDLKYLFPSAALTWSKQTWFRGEESVSEVRASRVTGVRLYCAAV